MRVLCFPKEGENPYLNQLSSRLEAAGLQVDEFSFPRAFTRRYDVVHMHWPDTHLWSVSWWRSLGKHIRLGLLCAWLRLRRTRIVWTLHNLHTHEKDHWIGATLFPRWFPRAITDVIALTPTGLELARRKFPALARKRSALIPHGHYRDVFPPAAPHDVSRARLGLERNRFTILFLGSIRRYKNVPVLIDAFRRLPDTDVQLVIAGQPVVGMRAEEIEAAAQGDPRVHLHLRLIPEAEMPYFYGAADLVVAPFSDILNSGSVLLALSMNRPVLAPRLGALPDLERVVGSRWLRLYDGELEPRMLTEARTRVARPDLGETVNLSRFDWPEIAQATIALYTPPRPGAVEPQTNAVPAASSAAGS